jgi:hypothetical protein
MDKWEVHRDLIAERLDEMADLCEHWKKNRERGRMPNAIRAALMMLAEECCHIKRSEERSQQDMMAAVMGKK